MKYIELHEEQVRESIDSKQMLEAFEDALSRSNKFKGSMAWKEVNGKSYLYRKQNSYAEWKSLGPDSEESRAKYSAFMEGKAEAKERLSSIKDNMDMRAKFAKAVGINRVSVLVANLCRYMEKSGLIGSVSVVGTNAIYAYESMAGCQVVSGLLATRDLDFLWDSKKKINLIVEENVSGFMDVLKKVDKSFERSKDLYRAINKDGFMVDLIKAEQKDMRVKDRDQLGDMYDLKASGIGSLRWLISSPKVHAISIDRQGYPFRISVPDPRCFAIHKLWLSERPDREPAKAKRDYEQAIAVADLILERLPMYPFKKEELKMFPEEIASKGIKVLSQAERFRS